MGRHALAARASLEHAFLHLYVITNVHTVDRRNVAATMFRHAETIMATDVWNGVATATVQVGPVNQEHVLIAQITIVLAHIHIPAAQEPERIIFQAVVL